MIEDRLKSFLEDIDSDDKERIETAFEALLDKKAERPMLFDLRGKGSYADFFIVCHGRSDRQVKALSDMLHVKMKQAGIMPLGTEGEQVNHWVLCDYDNLIVNLFYEPTRGFYDLEGLWSNMERFEPQEIEALFLKAPEEAE